MNKRSAVSVASAFVVGATVGLFIGRSFAPPVKDAGFAAQFAREASSLSPTKAPPGRGKTSSTLSPSLFAMRLRQAAGSASHQYDRFLALAYSIEPGGERAAMEVARKSLSNRDWDFFFRVLAKKWAETDAQGLLAYGELTGNRDLRKCAREFSLPNWARDDADAAFAWVEKLPPGPEREECYSATLRGLAEGDPERALEKLKHVRLSEQRVFRTQIIEFLAEKDPRRAAEMALRSDTGSTVYGQLAGRLGLVLDKWMQNEPEAAMTWLKAQPESIRQRQLVAEAIARVEPTKAMRLMELLPPGQARDDALGRVLRDWSQSGYNLEELRAWADQCADPQQKMRAQLAYADGLLRIDPAKAAAALANVPTDEQHAEVYRMVFLEFAQKDAQAALNMAQSLTDKSARQQALSGVLQGWAGVDPQAAANFTVGLPADPLRNGVLQQVMLEWSDRDPKAALAWLKQNAETAVASDLIPKVIGVLARSSPDAAAEFMAVLPPGPNQASLARSLVGGWMESDFEGARNWIKQLAEGPTRDAALERITVQWVNTDVKGAAEFAQTLPAGEMRDQFFGQIAVAWTARDPKGAAEFALSMSADASRQRMLEGVLSGWSSRNPEAAAQFALGLPEGPSRDEVLKGIAETWARTDAASALKWAQSLPPGEGRSTAMADALGAWAARSPLEAAKYVARLEGAEQERGMKPVIAAIAGQDPTLAASWIEQFPEGTLRQQSAETLVKRWAAQDPQAAATWLSNLPEGQRQEGVVFQFVQSAAAYEPQLAWTWATSLADGDVRNQALETAARAWLRVDDKAARTAIQATALPPELRAELLRSPK